MQFEWDKRKASTNLRKHRVAFGEAMAVFVESLARIFPDTDHSQDGRREIIIGYDANARLLIVSFVERHGAPFDKFGHSVAIDGTHAMIGADGVVNAQGAVYVFDESGGNWTQSQKLLASDGQHNDGLGFPVTLDGTRALAGAWGWPASAVQGAAYFFTTTADNDTIFADGFDGAAP